MKDSIFHKFNLKTPAYVYDAEKIINVLEIMNKIQEDSSCFLLYSIKSANNIGLLELIRPYVNGFSCSSMFELQLAKEILDSKQTVQELMRKQAQLEYEILGKVKRAVDKVAIDGGFDYIIDASVGLLYYKPKYDMTDDVLHELRNLDTKK